MIGHLSKPTRVFVMIHWSVRFTDKSNPENCLADIDVCAYDHVQAIEKANDIFEADYLPDLLQDGELLMYNISASIKDY